MLKYLELLRTKPKHVRGAYAFWTAFLVTLCIALVWSSSLSSLFDGPRVQEVATPQKEVQSSLSRVFTETKQRISATLASFRTRTTYEKKEEPVVVPSNTLDLKALYESGVDAKMREKVQEAASSTNSL